MRFRSLSLAIALLATPLAAEAQPFQGLYVGAGAGYNLPQNVPLAGGGDSWSRMAGSSGLAASATRWATGSASNWRATTARAHLGNTTGRTQYQRLRPDLWCHGQRVVRHRCRRAVDLSLYRRRGRLCADPSVAKRRLHARQLPADQQSVRPDRGKFRVPGNRWAVVPDPRRSGPVAHVGIPFLRRTGQRELRRHSGRGGLPAPVPVTLRPQHQFNHSFLLGVRYAFNVAPPVPVPPDRRPRRRPRPRAPIWCSSTGTRQRSPIGRARSSRRRPTIPPASSTRASR